MMTETIQKCYWLCNRKAEVWLYEPFLNGGRIPLCAKCHEIRDPYKRIKYDVIQYN